MHDINFVGCESGDVSVWTLDWRAIEDSQSLDSNSRRAMSRMLLLGQLVASASSADVLVMLKVVLIKYGMVWTAVAQMS